MGIPGLSTYISERRDVCFKDFELRDTYLVIDGNNIASQLYCQIQNSNSSFGGDYDKYALRVSKFFEDLRLCNIVPLIIIDGGCEDKKLDTVVQRTNQRIQTAASITPANQRNSQLFPLLMKEVFRSIARKKHIRYSYSLFEADDDLASVARLLNCPILSNDSDFYVFDVKFVPFWSFTSAQGNRSTGYSISCKMYRIDNFLQCFPGMSRDVLPVAAALLGNDYVKRSTFKDFFSTLKLSKTSKRRYNEMQKRIEAVFYFLQKYSINPAVARVLSKIKQEHRHSVLEIIEMIINGYILMSPKMLAPLGFSLQEINEITKRTRNCKPYKFSVYDLHNIKIDDSPKRSDESDLDIELDSTNGRSNDKSCIKMPKEIDAEKKFCDIVPEWFIFEFNRGYYPSYFIDMITRQFYVCPVQVENFQADSCMLISLKVIAVIFAILSKGTTNKQELRYYIRCKGQKYPQSLTLQCYNEYKIAPNLWSLRVIESRHRKKIMDDTIGITNEFLNEFPPNWQLYIACIKYWIDNAESDLVTNCHLYAVLFAMLFHIIDKNIGYHRSINVFNSKFAHEVARIRQVRQMQNYVTSVHMPVLNALQLISPEDCLVTAHFFIQNFEVSHSLQRNPKKYNPGIVHAFSLFQNCLRHINHLNTLLGYPYCEMNFEELFNGALLYNLYNNFRSRKDVNEYVRVILEQAPTLLQLFISMENVLISVFGKGFNNTVNRSRKKHRNRNKKSNYSDHYGDYDEFETSEPGPSSKSNEYDDYDEYEDPSNRYAILNRRMY